QAEVPHEEIVRADGLAETAGAAGIDELVLRAGCAENDLLIVEDLPGVFFRVSLVALQVETGLHTLHALALDATLCLTHSLRSGVTAERVTGRDARERFNPVDIGIETGGKRSFLVPAALHGDVHCIPVYGGSGTPSFEHFADRRQSAGLPALPAGEQSFKAGGQGERFDPYPFLPVAVQRMKIQARGIESHIYGIEIPMD